MISTIGIISFRFGSAHWHNFEFGKSPFLTDFFRLSLSRNQDSEGGKLVDCYINGFGRNHSCASFPSSCSRPLCLLGGSEALVCTRIFVASHSKNAQAQREFLSAAFEYPSNPGDVGTWPFVDAPHAYAKIFGVDSQNYDPSLAHAESFGTSDSQPVAPREEDAAVATPDENATNIYLAADEIVAAANPIDDVALPAVPPSENIALPAVPPTENIALPAVPPTESIALPSTSY